MTRTSSRAYVTASPMRSSVFGGCFNASSTLYPTTGVRDSRSSHRAATTNESCTHEYCEPSQMYGKAPCSRNSRRDRS